MSCFKDRKDITLNLSMEEVNVIVVGVASLLHMMLELQANGIPNNRYTHLPSIPEVIDFGGRLGDQFADEFPDWQSMYSEKINKEVTEALDKIQNLPEDAKTEAIVKEFFG